VDHGIGPILPKIAENPRFIGDIKFLMAGRQYLPPQYFKKQDRPPSQKTAPTGHQQLHPHCSLVLFSCGVFSPEAAVAAPIGYLIAAQGTLDGPCQQPRSHTQSDAKQSAGHRNTGFESVHFFLPRLGSAAFGTLGWNACHMIFSF
jgi:hypothetical protein